MERKVPLPCSEQSADRSVLSQINPVHRILSHLFNIYFSIIPLYVLDFTMVPILQVSQPKHCMHLSSPPYMLHVPPISSSLICRYQKLPWKIFKWESVKFHEFLFDHVFSF